MTPVRDQNDVLAIDGLVDCARFRRALMAVENALGSDADAIDERRAAVRALRDLAYETECVADEIGRVL